MQNITTGEIYYIGLSDYLKFAQEMAENGVFPIGEQYDQTIDNPFTNPPSPGQNTPPPPGSGNDFEAGAFSEITPGDIMREKMIDFTADVEDRFEKIKSKLFDFTPAREGKKTIRIPIEVPGRENITPIRQSSDTSDINNSDLNLKLKDLYKAIGN